jgi:hypothetical protein
MDYDDLTEQLVFCINVDQADACYTFNFGDDQSAVDEQIEESDESGTGDEGQSDDGSSPEPEQEAPPEEAAPEFTVEEDEV